MNRNKNFHIIIWLVGLSSLFIILFQLNWLHNNYQLTKYNFQESVKLSLAFTISELVKEKEKRTFRMDGGNGIIWEYQSRDSLFSFDFYTSYKSDQEPDFDDGFYERVREFKNEFESKRIDNKQFKENILLMYWQDSLGVYVGDNIQLDSLITKSLRQNDIHLEYTYGLKSVVDDKWSEIGGKFPKDTIALENANVIIESRLDENLHLVLYNQDRFLYKKLLSNIILSSLLMFTVLFSLWYALRIIFRQKKLSQIKTDFVNNMTHEFKTPIATIKMAAATIEELEIIKDEAAIKKFTKVIKAENERMNSQIEMVLNTAREEENFTSLQKQSIDMHTIIESVLESIRLKVENRQGTLLYNSEAINSLVYGDEIHLYQSINNLLDNAIKYSPDELSITVYTYNRDGNFIIDVSDKGIGIKKQDEKLIFEKFYRVSTKDLHPMKGFGLGLNYVKEIANAHGGTIKYQRNKIGSTFSLSIPLEK